MTLLPINARRRTTIPLFILVALICPFLTSCGKKDKNKAQVSGKVIFKGSPMKGGTLYLSPIDQKKTDSKQAPPPVQSQGAPPGMNAGPPPDAFPIPISPDGTFTASGVPVGKMKVTVQAAMAAQDYGQMSQNAPADVKVNTPNLKKADVQVVEIPQKYSSVQETPLDWDITPGKNPEKTFEIKD